MSKLTKEQVQELAEKVQGKLQKIYLICDEYLVCAGMVRFKNKLVIDILVNGQFNSEWVEIVKTAEELQEEPRRFWRHAIRSVYSPAKVKKIEKRIGKRECKKRGYYEKNIVPVPYWNTIMPFFRHIQRFNQSIEIISSYEHEIALEKLAPTVEQNNV